MVIVTLMAYGRYPSVSTRCSLINAKNVNADVVVIVLSQRHSIIFSGEEHSP